MEILHDTKAIQIVDANGYLLRALRDTVSGFGPRLFIDKVRRSKKPIVFVFDGYGGNDRRREHFPPYKSNRQGQGEDLFAMVNFIRELLSYIPSVIIQCPKWEADDVIATIVIRYAKTGQPVRIVTPDRDLFQLAALPNVELTCSYENIPPRLVRLYKTFVGDPSDNIPGIKRFGEKGWTAINHEAALRFINSPTLNEVELVSIGFKPGHELWVRENFELMRSMWNVVGLIEVPMEEVGNGTTVGSHNASMLEQRLKEFAL
jgi:5'-3' exonuclease